MNQSMVYVGLDVHKETIAVAVAHQDPPLHVEHLGEIANRPEAIRKLIERLRVRHQLRVCYEAGPCGYAVYRQLLADAHRATLEVTEASGADPGGHCGASQESSAVDLPPHIDTSDQPLPGPAKPDATAEPRAGEDHGQSATHESGLTTEGSRKDATRG